MPPRLCLSLSNRLKSITACGIEHARPQNVFVHVLLMYNNRRAASVTISACVSLSNCLTQGRNSSRPCMLYNCCTCMRQAVQLTLLNAQRWIYHPLSTLMQHRQSMTACLILVGCEAAHQATHAGAVAAKHATHTAGPHCGWAGPSTMLTIQYTRR